MPLLVASVSSVTTQTFAAADFSIFEQSAPELAALGIQMVGPGTAMVVVTDQARTVGRLVVELQGQDAVIFVDNAAGNGLLQASVRILGNGSLVFFNRVGAGPVVLDTVFLRSHRQFLFWGEHATSVGLSIEVEGDGKGVVIGDDALIANGVWIRNHDMHSMHDLATGALLTKAPVTTVLERHVWLCQDTLLLNCTRIGSGAIVGAKSMVRRDVPGQVCVVGSPGRIIRRNVSWGRSSAGMTAAEVRAAENAA